MSARLGIDNHSTGATRKWPRPATSGCRAADRITYHAAGTGAATGHRGWIRLGLRANKDIVLTGGGVIKLANRRACCGSSAHRSRRGDRPGGHRAATNRYWVQGRISAGVAADPHVPGGSGRGAGHVGVVERSAIQAHGSATSAQCRLIAGSTRSKCRRKLKDASVPRRSRSVFARKCIYHPRSGVDDGTFAPGGASRAGNCSTGGDSATPRSPWDPMVSAAKFSACTSG